MKPSLTFLHVVVAVCCVMVCRAVLCCGVVLCCVFLCCVVVNGQDVFQDNSLPVQTGEGQQFASEHARHV